MRSPHRCLIAAACRPWSVGDISMHCEKRSGPLHGRAWPWSTQGSSTNGDWRASVLSAIESGAWDYNRAQPKQSRRQKR